VCTKISRPSRGPVELADIFAQSGAAYIAQHGVSAIQHKAITTISSCRTARLGGHVLCCNHCGALEIAYNSCRYRHCPKCQAPKKVRWLDERKAELLPVPYFHVVFTLPHELNPLAAFNPVAIYNILFKAAWATVDTLGRDEKRLHGQMGMTAFLHTWNQKINQHIHLHCMVPAGALRIVDGKVQWHASKKDYLFPVNVMAKLFGKFFLTELSKAFKNNELSFKGCIEHLSQESAFMKFKAQLKPRPKTWNVYAKEPFNGAFGGMEYLARYFTKTAIGNERLLSFDEKQVTFKWRDSRHNNQTKVMVLETHEFIRRYLSHILPHGFMRVRYFGFLANAVKTKNIALIRTLLSTAETQPGSAETSRLEDIPTSVPKNTTESTAELMERIVGIDITLCKHCNIGQLEKIQIVPPNRLSLPIPWDTS
jgi:Putative transposase/Transposase zinc-binding domain